jgi:hypothetical protein
MSKLLTLAPQEKDPFKIVAVLRQLVEYVQNFVTSLGGFWQLTSTDITAFPTLNTNGVIEFLNETEQGGNQIWFSNVAGNPYAAIGCALTDGTGAATGRIGFATRGVQSDPLTECLSILTTGGTYSGSLSATLFPGGSWNYGCVNATGFQCFIGITTTAPNRSGLAAGGYFISYNDDTSGLSSPAWGTYTEATAKAGNLQISFGIEAAAGNVCGQDARNIDPFQVFGDGSTGPECVSAWLNATTTVNPGVSVQYAATSGIVILGGTLGGGLGEQTFWKGIVVQDTALKSSGGNKEAIALGNSHQISWYASAGGNVARLYSDGANLFYKAVGSTVLGSAALATTATDGFVYIPTCAGPPTGTPTARTGCVAMIYDTTNNKFYIYNGAWKGGTNPGVFT